MPRPLLPRSPRGRGALAVALVALAACAALAGTGLSRAGAQGPRPRIEHLLVRSAQVGRTLRVTLVMPAGTAQAPAGLLVLLHARGGTDTTALTPEFLGALERLGARAPAVVIPADDRTSFWHDRADGHWGRYVLREVLPRALALTGADPRRVAIGGVSMGGFGAYDLARLHPGRFCAVGGHSPAIFAHADQALPGAFDGPADFARHDVLRVAGARPAAWAGPPLWIDVGASDPFAPGARAFAAALRAGGLPVSFHSWPGGHDGRYWGAHWADYLRFYADALASCPPRPRDG